MLPFLLIMTSALAVQGEDPLPVSFQREVAPLLVSRCLGCHNQEKAENNLNISTFALLKKGGQDLGTGILEPGHPEESHLYTVLLADALPRMPYKQAPLADSEIALVERWIREGAHFDGPSETETQLATLVDPLTLLPRVSPQKPVSDPVTALAFLPDGKTLAAARGPDVLMIDVASGSLSATLSGQAGAINCIQASSDGKTLVAAGGRPGQFGTIQVWDLATHARSLELRGHSDAILSAALAADARTLATASYDRVVKVWDLAEARELRTLKEHTDAVYALDLSPDGTTLATAAGDRTVKWWEVATGRRLVSLSDATAELYAVAFSSDGSRIVAGGVDRIIRVWRVAGASASLERTAFAHDAPVLRLITSPDGRLLISSSEDRTIKLWSVDTLEPIRTLGPFTDWPLAIAISNGSENLAIGLYDGSVQIMALREDAPARTLLSAAAEPTQDADVVPAQAAPKQELVRNASLNPLNPRGGVRGSTLKVTLSGHGVGRTEELRVSNPGISTRLLAPMNQDAEAIDVELTIDPALSPGVYSLRARTPLGTTNAQPFAVSAYPEMAEVEPNDNPAAAPLATLPATWLGAINKVGDVDHLRIALQPGEALHAELLARPIGSSLSATLTLLDENGLTLARAARTDDGREPRLFHQTESAQTVSLRVADSDLGGSGNHIYRISIDHGPFVTSHFPLGVAADEPGTVQLFGMNVDAASVTVPVAPGTPPGSLIDVPTHSVLPTPLGPRLRVVVSEGSQLREFEPNDTAASALAAVAPCGVSGRIDPPGDVDHVRFHARKGERWVIEVFARRLGVPTDPVIEVLRDTGEPLPRAILRPVRETAVAFRDHPSLGRNIRLTWPWTGFEIGDYVLMGRELMRLHELPRNPDDDAVFWGLGNARNNTGDRLAFLETTPEHHPMGQPVYKVEVHPPNATFPPGGVAPVRLYHRNDDGPPPLGKDAKLTFDAPDDGDYVVRVADVRDLGGPDFGYHLVIRPARPGFQIQPTSADINIPRGSAIPLIVGLTRMDGFNGPVELSVEGLPPGITATSTRIEADQYAAELLFQADSSAETFPNANWTIVAHSVPTNESDLVVEQRLERGGAAGGWITVTPEPNLEVGFRPESLQIIPGQETTMTLTVDRRNGFEGRVPIEVRNLPFGVRVLHIGLNGVLVTEKQSERTVTFYAEPWVQPQTRFIHAVGKCEPAGTDHSSPPIPLTILPARPAAPITGSVETTSAPRTSP